MTIVSFEFLAFIAAVFSVFYIVPKKLQWVVLLIASIVFYWLVGGFAPVFITLTGIVAFIASITLSKIIMSTKNYIAENKTSLSLQEKKNLKKACERKKKAVLIISLILIIGTLAFFKYNNYIAHFIVPVLHSDKTIFDKLVIPLGISYYTFQTVGYLIDIYRDSYPVQKNPLKLLLFTCFFPQIVQGPINRYGELSKTLYAEHSFDFTLIKKSVILILWGYFKKIVIGDNLNISISEVVGNVNNFDGFQLIISMLLFGIQLYADFSGYTDIVLGVAGLFGVKMAENFERPYFAKSLAEHWQRWHITLGEWFKDYMFYSILRSELFMKIQKKKRNKKQRKLISTLLTVFGLLILWSTIGIWHGSTFNFLIFGLGNGIVMIFSFIMENYGIYDAVTDKLKIKKDSCFFRSFQIIRTYIIKCILSCFFVLGSMSEIKILFVKIGGGILPSSFSLSYLLPGLSSYGLTNIAITFGACILLFIISLLQRSRNLSKKIIGKNWIIQSLIIVALITSIIYFKIEAEGMSGVFLYEKF